MPFLQWSLLTSIGLPRERQVTDSWTFCLHRDVGPGPISEATTTVATVLSRKTLQYVGPFDYLGSTLFCTTDKADFPENQAFSERIGPTRARKSG